MHMLKTTELAARIPNESLAAWKTELSSWMKPSAFRDRIELPTRRLGGHSSIKRD
jgi:hypothetical protein